MQNLPAEIVNMIAHYLGDIGPDGTIVANSDLLRLRTVSRGMYRKTLDEFKAEYFHLLTLYPCSEEDLRQTSTMLDYEGFRAVVQGFIVEDTKRLPPNMTILSSYDLLRSQLANMANLHEIKIVGRGNFALNPFGRRDASGCNKATHAILAALVATNAPITAISIQGCIISQGAVSAFLRAKANTLQELTMTDVLCYDGDWSPLFRLVRDDLCLTHVHTNELHGNRDWDKVLSCNSDVVRAVKDKETGKIGHYRVRTQAAWMHGEAAVKAGCAKLLELPYLQREL